MQYIPEESHEKPSRGAEGKKEQKNCEFFSFTIKEKYI